MIKQSLLQSNFLKESGKEQLRMLDLYNFDIDFLKSQVVKNKSALVRKEITKMLNKSFK